MDHLKYEIIIFWSGEDELYIAEVPDLPGCTAHGDTYDEASQSIQEAMALWLDVAREFGNHVPEPKGHRLMVA